MNISPAVCTGVFASLSSFFGKLSGLEFEFLDVVSPSTRNRVVCQFRCEGCHIFPAFLGFLLIIPVVKMLGYSPDITPQNYSNYMVSHAWRQVVVSKLRYITRGLCFSIMVFLNSLVWTFFVKALHNSKTVVEATAVSTAINYALSGILGFVFFNEVTGILWWFGISLLVLGVIVVTHSSTDESKNLRSLHKEVD